MLDGPKPARPPKSPSSADAPGAPHRVPDSATAFGVVLAAGRSTRMGRVKPLLEVDGSTLLARAAEVLRAGGCAEVMIVVNEAASDVRAVAAEVGRVVAAPDRPEAEPIDSLRLALATVPAGVGAVVVLPVDCPFVRADTVRRLLAVHGRGESGAVVPEHAGVAGHPVVLGRSWFEAVGTADLPEGLRSLFARRSDVVRVAVDDAGTTVDVDTPVEARRHGIDV